MVHERAELSTSLHGDRSGLVQRANAGILLLPALAVIVLLWLPFGWHMGPLLEEWGVLGLYAEHGVFYFAGAHSLMAPHQMRPIMTALWGLAYAVDPDSWWFWHVELAFALLVKGAAMTWLALYLADSRRWAVIAGLLFVVWPADVMQMAFRAMPISFSVAMTVAAAALFIGAHLTPDTSRRWILSLCAAALLLMGTLTYELALLFSPLPFLFIYVREGYFGARKMIRRAWQVGATWLLAVGACTTYILWVLFTAPVLYQKAIAPPDARQLFSTLIERVPMLLSYGVTRLLATAWTDAARILAEDFAMHGYFLVVAVVFLCVLWAVRGRKTAHAQRLIRGALVGFLCMVVGYAPFLVSHANTSERVFMFAALGATLVYLSLLMAVDRLNHRVAAIAAVALLTLGTAQQLWQFREYSALSERQREIMKAMVEQVPSMAPDQTMIVLDASEQLGDVWMLEGLIPSALTYLYGKPVRGGNVLVCFPAAGTWPARDAAMQQGTCSEMPESWLFRVAAPVAQPGPPAPIPPDLVIPKAKAVVVRIAPNGTGAMTPSAEAQKTLLQSETTLVGSRYRHALAMDSWPAMLRFLDFRPSESYRWDFGRRWTMQEVMHGSGWSVPGWVYPPWHSVSVVWMNKPDASLIFDLVPVEKSYRLSAHVTVAQARFRTSLRIWVNGVEVPIVWKTPSDFTAEVPREALQGGSNVLQLQTAPSSEHFAYSLQFDWINLAPSE